MKLPILLLLVLLVALPSFAATSDALQVTQTPAAVSAKPGEAVTITAVLKNTLTPKPPILFESTVEFTVDGVNGTDTDSTVLTTIQPVVKAKRYKLVLPALFAFVAGSAKVNNQPFVPVETPGLLTFEFGERTLAEGETLTLGFAVKGN
jgi:uncharacterized protein (DUF58 family)